MLQLFMAISPILIVMIGIVGLKKPATIVSAIALIYTIFVTMFYGKFKLENAVLFSETTKRYYRRGKNGIYDLVSLSDFEYADQHRCHGQDQRDHCEPDTG